MANIDLQSLMNQLSSSIGVTSGVKAEGQERTAGQLFGSILGQQQYGAMTGYEAGNNLPGGNTLPTETTPVGVPANVELATALVSLAQLPEQSASLSIQDIQGQLKQLMQSDPVSQASIDDLTALTNLLAGIDTLPLNSQSSASASIAMSASPRLLDDVQLLQAAQEMGIDPSVASLILQTTSPSSSDDGPAATASWLASNNPPSTDIPSIGADLIQPLEVGSSAMLVTNTTPAIISEASKSGVNVLTMDTPAGDLPEIMVSASADQPEQMTPVVPANQAAPLMPTLQTEVGVHAKPTTPTVQASQTAPVMPAQQTEVGAPAKPAVSTVRASQTAPVVPSPQAEAGVQAKPITPAVQPTLTSPVGQNQTVSAQLATTQAQAQVATQIITDEAVIRVRQTGAQITTRTTANSPQTLTTQDFLSIRAAQVPTASSQVVRGATAADNIVMQLPSALLKKLDQVSATQQATSTVATEPMSAPMMGASFKPMAQMQTLVSSVQTTVIPAEGPAIEGGSRLQSFLATDNPAQQAARNMQNQMGQQLQRMVRDGQWQANISLNPARLGQIKINMTMEDGVLKTQLLSANHGVRELLEGGIPRLRELLEESGLQLGKFDVASDTASQQFANQHSGSGELSQTKVSESTGAENTEQRSPSHDGDLDTFA